LNRQKFTMTICMLIATMVVCTGLSAQLSAPNLTESNGNRVGKWIFCLDENLNEITDSTDCTYYKVVNYVTGRPIGFVNYYYKSGKMYFQTPVRSLNPDVYSDGEIRFFSESGDKIKTITYQNGVENGLAVYYYSDGKEQLQGNYTDGKKSGIWKQWDPDGKYGIGSFANDLPEGKWTFYYADGSLRSEGKFHNGIQSGVWTEYTETGDTAEGTYLNGLPEGTWVCQYKNKKPCYIGSYSKGLKDGFWQEWDIMGRLSRGSYLNDAREGTWTLLDPNGNKLMEGNYSNGKEEGPWKRFDKAGNVVETIQFQNGVRIK